MAGKLAAGFIRGVEGQGVGSSLKHFAANSQELSRFNSDSVVDGRTLRELYLTRRPWGPSHRNRAGMPCFSYALVSQKLSPEQRAILSSKVICCNICLPSYTENRDTEAMVDNLSEEVFDTYLCSHNETVHNNPPNG